MSDKRRIIAGNWKMYKTAKEAVFLVQELEVQLDSIAADGAGLEGVEVIVCPPLTALKSIYTVLGQDKPPIKLGAQNMHWEDEGAYTGEVSPVMLKDLECEFVIIGHSERRMYFGETDETVNKKVKAALAHNITPIMCCGESLEQRESGQAEAFIGSQILAGTEGLSESDMKDFVIAYEPIWAIGTGKTALPEDANNIISHIRKVLASRFNEEIAKAVPVLYGGSVKGGNIAEFMAEPDINGALVGGASLEAESFASIVRNARKQ
ncbi:MAG: triose-phosphate isomerase [Actinomycetota bacterium]|nr:triose-phosphate isomerase [Actinomycetota bacterium]